MCPKRRPTSRSATRLRHRVPATAALATRLRHELHDWAMYAGVPTATGHPGRSNRAWAASPSGGGHGLRLVRTLADHSEVVHDDQGTTVLMSWPRQHEGRP
jgi:histidine kinase-like protein